jgi:hypothetical protein
MKKLFPILIRMLLNLLSVKSLRNKRDALFKDFLNAERDEIIQKEKGLRAMAIAPLF